MKGPYPKNIHKMSQGPPNPGFRSVILRIFSKRTHNILKILFNLGFYEYLMDSQIRRCPFLLFIIVKNSVIGVHRSLGK